MAESVTVTATVSRQVKEKAKVQAKLLDLTLPAYLGRLLEQQLGMESEEVPEDDEVIPGPDILPGEPMIVTLQDIEEEVKLAHLSRPYSDVNELIRDLRHGNLPVAQI
jgi:hypothetical protein